MSNDEYQFLEARIGALEILAFNTPEKLQTYIFSIKNTIVHPSMEGRDNLKDRFRDLLEVLEKRLQNIDK